MKVNSQSFPYPMLTPADAGNDYYGVAFQCVLDFDDKLDENENIILDYENMLSVEEIQDLIDKNSAQYCLEIACSETLFRKIFNLDRKGQLKLDATLFHGKVDFTPMVVTKGCVPDYYSVDFNPEYGGETFDLNAGDILATDDTTTHYIEFTQLAFDSLVKIRTDEDLPPLVYSIDPTPQHLYITMGKDIRSIWNEIGNDKEKQSYLAMSVYKDCLLMAIEELVNNEDAESQQWARSLLNKLRTLKISLPNVADLNEMNIIAQKLIKDVGIGRIRQLRG